MKCWCIKWESILAIVVTEMQKRTMLSEKKKKMILDFLYRISKLPCEFTFPQSIQTPQLS